MRNCIIKARPDYNPSYHHVCALSLLMKIVLEKTSHPKLRDRPIANLMVLRNNESAYDCGSVLINFWPRVYSETEILLM